MSNLAATVEVSETIPVRWGRHDETEKEGGVLQKSWNMWNILKQGSNKAREILITNSDVWSFGVVIWEILEVQRICKLSPLHIMDYFING